MPAEESVPLGRAEIRAGVEAMLAERAAPRHRHPTLRERQEGEMNALRGVLRLIDTGDWHDPPRSQFCHCGAPYGHYGAERCKPKPDLVEVPRG